jgi:hypothetical protein
LNTVFSPILGGWIESGRTYSYKTATIVLHVNSILPSPIEKYTVKNRRGGQKRDMTYAGMAEEAT